MAMDDDLFIRGMSKREMAIAYQPNRSLQCWLCWAPPSPQPSPARGRGGPTRLAFPNFDGRNDHRPPRCHGPTKICSSKYDFSHNGGSAPLTGVA